MQIDWMAFTPLSALVGGVIIGIGVAVLLLFNGRIAGVSGIVGGLFGNFSVHFERAWRAAFVGGLIVAPSLYRLFAGDISIALSESFAMLSIAGLLTGIGTGMAAGCTSGHGVCGLSRLSSRSMVATLTFMASGFITVFIMRHVIR
ncbi:MAG: YeeE/YedE family protein [Spongiibacteraceae bacterium]